MYATRFATSSNPFSFHGARSGSRLSLREEAMVQIAPLHATCQHVCKQWSWRPHAGGLRSILLMQCVHVLPKQLLQALLGSIAGQRLCGNPRGCSKGIGQELALWLPGLASLRAKSSDEEGQGQDEASSAPGHGPPCAPACTALGSPMKAHTRCALLTLGPSTSTHQLLEPL